MRSYIYSTVFLIAMVFIVLACSDNKSSIPNNKLNISDVKHPMAGIIGKGGSGNRKSAEIKNYLRGKYKGLAKGRFGAGVDYRYKGAHVGSIEKIRLVGDFAPPGYVKRADVDEDIRARSRAFLEEEAELLGFNDLEKELGGGARLL